MDFFGRQTFQQRSSYFDPWGSQPRVFYPQQQFYSPRSRQPRKEVFIDPEDYYDPIFGENKKSDAKCKCRDCRIHEAAVQQRKNQQNVRRNAFKKRQRQSTYDGDVVDDANTVSEEDKKFDSPQNHQDTTLLVSDVDVNKEESSDVEQRLQDIDIQSETEKQSDEERESFKESEDESQSNSEESESEDDHQQPEQTHEDPIQQKLKTINDIQSEVEKLDQKVAKITDESKKYDYLYCEEMLTKCLLKLDDILADGEDVIRTARKRLVNDINRALASLEEKREVNASE